MWRSSASRAGRSMIGPTSVSGSAGSPTFSSASAPARSCSTRGAQPASTNRMRCAEQRWPARWKGGGDLAGEDGERKVPGGDAGEDAAAVELQFVTLAGGACKLFRFCKIYFCLYCVVAAEVCCLAHFRHRVGISAAALAHDEGDQVEHAFLQQVGGALQDRGTPGGGHVRPGLEALRGASDGAIESDGWRG